MHRKPHTKAFTLIEMVIAATIMVTAGLSALYLLRSPQQREAALVSKELKQLWIAQRTEVANQVSDPPNAVDPRTMPITSFINPDALTSDSYGTIDMTVTPPTHSLDGTRNDEAKTSTTTGDNFYDVGPEY